MTLNRNCLAWLISDMTWHYMVKKEKRKCRHRWDNIFAQSNIDSMCWPIIYIFFIISCVINKTNPVKIKGLFNPFSHTTILQQTTLNIFCQKIENLYNWMNNLWLKVENIVAKDEIARFEQFLLLSLCFQKAVCCRGVI